MYSMVPGKRGVKSPIIGATNLTYEVPRPITCSEIGTYTISVCDGTWNSYEASATVSTAVSSSYIEAVTLRIIPENLGGGTWDYQWFYSQNGSAYTSISGANSDSHSPAQQGFYKAVATSQERVAVVRAYLEPYHLVRVLSTKASTLALDFRALSTGLGPNRWVYSPWATGSQQDTGVTGNNFTLNVVDCSKAGIYSFQSDCASSSAASILLEVQPPSVDPLLTELQILPSGFPLEQWSYQWSFDDNLGGGFQEIQGETGSTYTPEQAGTYRVIATHGGIEAELQFYVIYTGASAWIWTKYRENAASGFMMKPEIVGVLGHAQWQYKWYHDPDGNSEQDTGVTLPEYIIPPASCANYGTYRVRVSNQCGQTGAGEVYFYDSTCN